MRKLLLGLALAFGLGGPVLAQSGVQVQNLTNASPLTGTETYWCAQQTISVWHTRNCSAAQYLAYLEGQNLTFTGNIALPVTTTVGGSPIARLESLSAASPTSSTDIYWCAQVVGSVYQDFACTVGQYLTWLEAQSLTFAGPVALPAATTVNGTPAVAGPSSDISGNVPVFSGTGGNLLADGGSSLTSLKNPTQVNGVSYPSLPSTNTVPVVTGSGVATYEAVPNAALAHASLTIGSTAVSLGGTITTLPGVTSVNGVAIPAASDTVALLATAQSVTGTKTFSNGGVVLLGSSTGATTLSSANAGASNFTLTLPALTDTVTTLTATQTLTNKSIAASEINSGTLPSAQLPLATTSTSGAVTVGSGLSVSSGVLSKTALAFSQTSFTGPVAPPNSSSYYYMGVGAPFTPVGTRAVLTVSGTIITASLTAGDGMSFELTTGTGTAPTLGTSFGGTGLGNIETYKNPTTFGSASNQAQPFSIQAIVTGLTPGTAIWIDLAAKAIAGGGSEFSNLNVTAVEF